MKVKRWTLWLAVLALAATPVAWADEEEPSPETDPQVAESAEEETAEEVVEEAEEEEQADEDKPARFLAELVLDQNVISARMLNIPWSGRAQTFHQVMDKIDGWVEQDEVGAVMIRITSFYLPLPEIEEMREGIARLKSAGKKVYAYLDLAGPEGYLLACAADQICIAPSGAVALPGFGRAFPFMKGHYQMMGLEFDVITAGEFKYPGFLNQREPNDYFVDEMDALLDSWFEDYVEIVAEERCLDSERVCEFIDQAVVRGKGALNLGLVDYIAFPDAYRERILRRSNMELCKDDQIDWSQINSFQDILNLMSREWESRERALKAIGPKIAVLTLRGVYIDVSLGPTFANIAICRDDVVKTLEEIRRDKSIKGLVVRIDSGGGSGSCSSAIYQKLVEMDKTKPVVVSMGRVAASAGYHSACPARLIFVEPTTITGSIGVLGILPSNWSQLNRSDYNMYTIRRGARSSLLSNYKPLSEEDRAFVQELILKSYDDFIDDVARGRKMAREQVLKLAGGRVYSGRDAIDVGLADRIGGINEAVEAVRELAGMKENTEVSVVQFPQLASLGEAITDLSSAAMVFGLGFKAERGADPMIRWMQMAEAPAEPLAVERQLRILPLGPKPLYWMPLPDVHRLWHPHHESITNSLPLQEQTPAMVREFLTYP